MIKVLAIIGTRPQYIKHAAFNNACKIYPEVELITVDTGQHYDNEMSKVFIRGLGIDTIKYNLEVKCSLHGGQTGNMMIGIEEILLDEQPDYVVVYGDTNSTLAGSISAVKLKIPIVHIEAGLRNGNLLVPEEVNRSLTDRISSLKIVPSETAMFNLKNEGLGSHSYLFGDITTDLLLGPTNSSVTLNNDEEFYYVTVHRPYNTGEKKRFVNLLAELNYLDSKVIFPIHPRTKKMMKTWGLNFDKFPNIEFHKPFDFFKSIEHIKSSVCVITDSGGVQKESYILKKKCISILPKTPWEETIIGNWNMLIFDDLSEIHSAIKVRPIESKYKPNYFGDGKVASKIVDLLINER